MISSAHPPVANRLLAALSLQSRTRLIAACDLVELEFGEVICEADERIGHVYFPTTGFISLITALDANARLEVGIIGSEGMLGAELVLGMSASPQQAIVQGAGLSLRMSAASFRRSWSKNDELHLRLDRYVYVLMQQLALTAACNRHHVVEARLARWLLMSRDRAHRDDFHLTQEFLAYMLGVRRVGVTHAARALHERGLINYSRGHINIRDNRGLERTSCKCYARGNEIYEQSLSSARATLARNRPRLPAQRTRRR